MNWTSILHTLINRSRDVLLAYLAYSAIVKTQTASKELIIEGLLEGLHLILETDSMPTLIYYTIVAALIAWAIIERKLRQSYIKRADERIKSLESQLDRSRSSSNLTPEGKTNPEDA